MRIIIKVRINYRVEISGQFIYKVSERIFWVIWKRRFLKYGCSALKLMDDLKNASNPRHKAWIMRQLSWIMDSTMRNSRNAWISRRCKENIDRVLNAGVIKSCRCPIDPSMDNNTLPRDTLAKGYPINVERHIFGYMLWIYCL